LKGIWNGCVRVLASDILVVVVFNISIVHVSLILALHDVLIIELILDLSLAFIARVIGGALIYERFFGLKILGRSFPEFFW
jgi:hypothetical protein